MAKAAVPRIVKHMTVAIMSKSTGRSARGFLDAYEIAKAQLSKYGYLTGVGKKKGPEDLKLTSKGMVLERRHLRCPKSGAKSKEFDLWWQKVEPVVSEQAVGQAADDPTADPDRSARNAEQKRTATLKDAKY